MATRPSVLMDEHNSNTLVSSQTQKIPPSRYPLHLQSSQNQQQLYVDHLESLRKQAHDQSSSSQPQLSARQMLAAQQHFGMQGLPTHLQQQYSQQQNPLSNNESIWSEDQEVMLRNLLANSTDTPPNSQKEARHSLDPSSGTTSSLPDEGRYSSLSPSSSSGFQGLHDFIHSNRGFPTPPESDASGYHRHSSDHLRQSHSNGFGFQMLGNGQLADPSALNFLLPSINQGHLPHNNQQQALGMSTTQPDYGVQSSAPTTGLDPALVSSGHQMPHPHMQMQFNQPFALQFAPQHQHSMPIYPGIDPRKRPAEDAMQEHVQNNSESQSTQHLSNNKDEARANKKARSPSSFKGKKPEEAPTLSTTTYGAPSFMPHMEVGSNATAKAAIERLKAKKKAESVAKVKQEYENSTLLANSSDIPANSNRKVSNAKGAKGGPSGDSSGLSTSPAEKQQKKVAHNAIERRYRNNINDRITALRLSVPALRELRPKKPGSRKGRGAQEQDLVDGVPAATKINKATILGKATEYIRYLKGREMRLVSEGAGLRELVRSLEGGEELLELWEGEMEKVVAEQEAQAKASFEDDGLDFDEMLDDDEDDEEDEVDGKNSRTPSSSSSSSRYMMGVFMGVSVLGGGAELVTEHAASSASEGAHNTVRRNGGRVIGASHQLLKRSMAATRVNVGKVVEEPHHYDHMPSHVLMAEIVRAIVFIACIAFVFWPLISKVMFSHRAFRSRVGKESIREESGEAAVFVDKRRKEMLTALGRTKPDPREMDLTMRRFIGAPTNALSASLALSLMALQEDTYKIGLQRRRATLTPTREQEIAAVWCRLIDLETSLGPLAQGSLLARVHALFKVGTLPNLGSHVSSLEENSTLSLARVHGTMAIAIVRAAKANLLVMPFAEHRWVMARRCRLVAADDDQDQDDSESKLSKVSERWLDSVVDLPLTEAIAICPPPTRVAAAFSPNVDPAHRASLISPMVSIATSLHAEQLSAVWSTILNSVVKATCPLSNETPMASEFARHHANLKIQLDIVEEDAVVREKLTSQIAHLTASCPPLARSKALALTAFGVWALFLGNLGLARRVAAAVVPAVDESAAARCFLKLVLSENLEVAKLGEMEAKDDVDALAASSLAWLRFLRLFTSSMNKDTKSTDSSNIIESSLAVRRLLAGARPRPVAEASNSWSSSGGNDINNIHRNSLVSTSSTPSSASESSTSSSSGESSSTPILRVLELEESIDTLTDILAALCRKASLLGSGNKSIDWLDDSESDSGVEWAFSE